MAQPNLAREPSMDEILASIRKIIENNEFGTAAAADEQDVVDESDEVRLTVDDDLTEFATSPDVDSGLQRETYSYKPAQPPERMAALESAPQPAAPRSMSLADVAARVRAASEQRISQAISGNEPVIAAPARPVVSPAPEVRAIAPQASVEPAMEERKAMPVPGRVLAVSGDKEQAPIMSPDVGEKVSRAFESLSVAIDGGSRRSFDEIAEEMMRPMLQDWMDDNLPKLVERLVREEIERVARGPRR